MDYILYLSECPAKKMNGSLDGILLKSWERTKYFIEKENMMKKEKPSFSADISCCCYIEYGDSKFPREFGGEGGTVNYSPGGKRYHCAIKIENDAQLFDVLKKQMENTGILIDSSNGTGKA